MDTNAEVNQEDVKKMNDKTETVSFYSVVRRITLAGIGAIALKHDELEEFIDKLVERGEIAKTDGESLMKEMKERRSKYLHNETGYAHKRFAEFLDRFAVPTKNDLDDLSEKISALEKKIDELTKPKE
jgi:poly(hydroxyalkanoate) granule-associated protein